MSAKTQWTKIHGNPSSASVSDDENLKLARDVVNVFT